MKYIREQDVDGDKFPPPFAREIKHVAAPWTLGTKNLWLGVDLIEPHNTSNPHSHDDLEEIFYVVSGQGRIVVGDEEVEASAGLCVYVPPLMVHQLINDGNEVMKVVNVTSPPFVPEKFRAVHR